MGYVKSYNMTRITSIVGLLFITPGIAGGPHFTQDTVSRHVCSDVRPGTTLEDHVAIGGVPPLHYTLTENSTLLLRIDKRSGSLTFTGAVESHNETEVTAYVRATDSHGERTGKQINIIFNKTFVTTLTCPKIEEFIVREIAPVGEEVSPIQCNASSLYPTIPDKRLPLAIYSKGISSVNVPFNVTEEGMIIVAKPLTYRHRIQDIHIINVTLVYLEGDQDALTNCNRTEIKVTVKIRVEQADCPSNWTSEIDKNVYLDVAPMITIPKSKPEECMVFCTTNTSYICQGFNYNVLKKECLLVNETKYSLQNATKSRHGMFLYRKHCITEILPKLALRNAMQMVHNISTLSIQSGYDVLDSIVLSTNGSGNLGVRDTSIILDILQRVVQKTERQNVTQKEMKDYIEMCGHLLDKLITQSRALASRESVVLHRVLNVFNLLMELFGEAAVSEWDSFSIRTSMTAFKIKPVCDMRISSTISTSVARSGLQLEMPSVNLTENALNSTIATVGTIFGLHSITIANVVESSGNVFSFSGPILAISVKPDANIVHRVQLDIYSVENGDSDASRLCAFYLEQPYMGDQAWSTHGCQMISYNRSHTRCLCSHLTNFAVLMQVTPFQLSDVHAASLDTLTVIGLCISIAALSTTVAVLLWFRLKSERYVLLLHLSVAVALAQVVFLAGIDAVQNKIICRMVAILLHYLYLSVFTLMLAEGIHLFHKLHLAFHANEDTNMYLILGWGSPFVVVSMTLLTTGDGYSTPKHCWLSTDGAIWAFVGPALTIAVINVGILTLIIRTFIGITIVAKKGDLDKFKLSLRAAVILLPLLGVTWMFGVFAVNKSTVVFQYIFAVLNSLQGLFIFLFHVVCNEDVKRACARRYRRSVASSSCSLPDSPATEKRSKKASIYKTEAF